MNKYLPILLLVLVFACGVATNASGADERRTDASSDPSVALQESLSDTARPPGFWYQGIAGLMGWRKTESVFWQNVGIYVFWLTVGLWYHLSRLRKKELRRAFELTKAGNAHQSALPETGPVEASVFAVFITAFMHFLYWGQPLGVLEWGLLGLVAAYGGAVGYVTLRSMARRDGPAGVKR